MAKKEHAQIVSVLKSIEALLPGLYGMEIAERAGSDGKPSHDVSFVELRLEEIVPKLNRFQRQDEKPFEALRDLSEFNQRAYELLGRPVVKAFANEPAARLMRAFHPMRLQRWAASDLNPWLWWLAPAAQAVKAQRQALTPDHPGRRLEGTVSELTSAGLDGYRGLRDALSEAAFFQFYGNLCALHDGEDAGAEEGPLPAADPRELPAVKQALAAIDRGGYPEALARVACCWRTGTSPCRCRACSSRMSCSRNIATCCPSCRATRCAASAASRKSSRATNRKERSRRYRCCWRARWTASGS